MNPRKLTTMVAQINAIRASADAVIFMLEEEVEAEDQNQAQDCPHPNNARIDCSTMGHKAWTCSLCGYEEEEKGDEASKEESK